ncbi:MAG: AAA family ATPase [Pegethrix bostrychoides GSE-TBD4-15B]|jgi:archaellum biogenesis ATPase FlaH|uniref:AAA family ATPase n=1 Tax=Pegethrix bostrychoides GSE-TBD4-15B TaxID=2839662 RepID=A0A951P9N0_9CYAN|nr:AAA family ATPase [Pegethrix bostrychoides GSE-TBD4-15B]
MNPVTDAMQADMRREVSDELLSAMRAPSRAYTKAQVAQVAKAHQIPLEVAEEVAAAIFQQVSGIDIEHVDFQSLIKQIAEIEASVTDQGLRLYKLQALAKRHKRSYREIMECFNKALLNQQPIKPMSLADLRAKTDTDTPWLIPGWLPQGTNLLFYGDGGTGKTLMAYQWLESIVMGTPWNGYQVKQGRGLLVQCDEPEIVLRSRMDLLQLPDDAPLDILTDWTLDAIARLRTYIEQQQPAFILIDSLSAVNQSSLFSENDMEYARPILQLTQLCSEFNVTICLIHHSNAAGQARGTRAIHNSVSEVWGLAHADSAGERILSVQKTRLGRAPGRYRFIFDEDAHSFTYLGHADDEDGASVTQEEKIRLWLHQDDNRGIAYAPIEIAQSCSISQPSTRRALQELWSKGVISRRPSSTRGHRGYLYFACLPQFPWRDQAYIPEEPPISDLRSNVNPHENNVLAIDDRGIGVKNTFPVQSGEKERSSERESLEVIQGNGLDVIGASDRDSGMIGDDRAFEGSEAIVIAPPLQKGDPVEVWIDDEWIPATYRIARERMYYSKRIKSLSPASDVEIKGNRFIISDDCIRRPDQES